MGGGEQLLGIRAGPGREPRAERIVGLDEAAPGGDRTAAFGDVTEPLHGRGARNVVRNVHVGNNARGEPWVAMDGLDGERAAARGLFERDEIDAARAAYLALVQRAPDHAGVLGDAGTFFFKTGSYAAAQTAFERAVAFAPESPRAHINLGNVHFALGAFDAARAAYTAALALDPDDADAHQGLSYALVRLDRDDDAVIHRQRGFIGRSITTAPYRGSAPPIDVLVLVAAAGGTIYTDSLLDDTRFRVTTLVADADDPAPPPLPAYDVIFNALADADRVADALGVMDRRFGASSPLLNPPRRVLATTRVGNARRLDVLPGVVAPRAVAIARTALERSGATALLMRGFTFPLLLRSPGYQTGRHFVRVPSAEDLPAAVAALPGETLLAIAFVDVQSGDGLIRKYRMMIVDGVLYPMHAAVADDWKVHYVTARMDEAAHRAEDARFLADPAAVLGAPAMAALAAIRDTLGLDYAGIDFSLDAEGRVIVFEANATMIVLPPGPESHWDYRRAPVARVIDAVRTMIASVVYRK